MKNYRVTHLTKKGGWEGWFIDVQANTAKEAVAIAKDKWSRISAMHPFQIDAKVLTTEVVSTTFAKCRDHRELFNW